MPLPSPAAAPRPLLLLALLLVGPPGLHAQHDHAPADTQNVGQVEFTSNCIAEVEPRIDRAVAMLHSFWFDAAEREFTAAAAADPSCVAAHWGLAMTRMGNPMTRVLPTPEALAAGREAAEAARHAAEGRTARGGRVFGPGCAHARDGFGTQSHFTNRKC